MSINSATFSRDVLHSEENFRQIFNGEKAIREISQLSDRDKITPYKPTPYYNRWQVAWIIVSMPFKGILWLVIKAVEKIAQCVGAKNLSIRCNLQADRFIEDFAYCFVQGKGRYRKNILCPTYNRHQIDTSDLYLQSPRRIDSIDWLKDKIKGWFRDQNEITSHIQFYHQDGICRGGLEWFFYLYMHSLDMPFSSPHARLQAVAKQFEKGMPRQAALIQSLSCEGMDEVLSLSREVPIKTRNTSFDTTILSTPEGKRHIEGLSVGNYVISYIEHTIGYFKINEHLGFIFDANFGLLCFEGENHSQQVADFFKLYSDGNKRIICWMLDKNHYNFEENPDLSAAV